MHMVVQHGVFIVAGFLPVTPKNLYTVYPLSDQAVAGVVLVVLMLLLDFTIVPLWLCGFFGRIPGRPGRGDSANLNVGPGRA
jgi:hypothetical protein